MAKNLVVFYSRKGENHMPGGIQVLPKGHTAYAAEFICDAVDADLSVAINVERVRGYSVAEYSDIITAQVESGVWSVTEAEFGADHKKATTVMYEEDTEAGTVYYAVTLAKDGTDILVVETVTYEGLSAEMNRMIREMLMTFEY